LTYPFCNYIYTDGSVCDGRVGVAVYIPSFDISVAYRSVDNLSVHTAELEAIYTAISLIVKHNICNPLILSDSLNVIEEFRNIPSIFNTSLMQFCRNLLTVNDVKLKLCWIPGHRGIIDHDTADHLAKSVLVNESFNNIVVHNLLEVSEWTVSDSISKWNRGIPEQTTGTAYHKLFPSGRPPSLSLSPRKKDTVISRLRLHSCFLNKYLLKIGLHQTGLCETCLVPETVDHFLFHCNKHKELSILLLGSASALGHSTSLNIVLSLEPYMSIIYCYVTSNSIRI